MTRVLKNNKDYKKVLEKAFREEDFELFKKTLKPNDNDNIKRFLEMSIENYLYDFSKFIIEKFNKYEMASQLALQSGDLKILKLCIEKIGYRKLVVDDTVLKILKQRLNSGSYDLFEYLLDNTTVLTPADLTEILCSFVDSTDKVIYFLTKINFSVDLDKLNECALDSGNVDVMNSLVNKGAKPFDETTIQFKVDEKKKRELKKRVNRWINIWIDNSSNVDRDLSDEMIRGLRDTIKSDNYTLYRGLTWSKNKMDANLNIDELKTKNTLALDLDSFTSWSTNKRVAEFYSKNKVLSVGNDYGLILQLTVDKSQVLADLTHKDNGEFFFYKNPPDDDDDEEETYTVGNQSEIILLPGKYNCKILQLRIDDKLFNKM